MIGITGSNGKTTTKNILSTGIKNSFSTFKNFNNEIGLPLCALMLDSKNEVAVFEMGAAKKGDIHFLSKIIQPDIGIITHIGHSHLLGLNSLKGVLEVKSELIHNIKKNGDRNSTKWSAFKLLEKVKERYYLYNIWFR